MAYTVEPTNAQTIDLSHAKRDAIHRDIKYNEKFASTATVEKVIVFDPLKEINLQINGNGVDKWGLETTTHAGFENADILHATKVPWIVLKDIATNIANFQTGGTGFNTGILAVRITSVLLTDDFEINAGQQVQEMEPR